MIFKIENVGDGAWRATTKPLPNFSHACGADYFPAAAIAQTAEKGLIVYFEGEILTEDRLPLLRGDVVFGAESTLDAYEAQT